MNNFEKLNTFFAWLVFAIALIVYLVTMEPTASFWDCGEFIAASYKLQVPHPPGAPLFLVIGRMFSFLSFGDVEKVAWWINFSSVVAGAFTAMLLFLSITLLAKKLTLSNGEVAAKDKAIGIIGAGLVGSLAYTFSDSAWFSSVEAEVYSMSSFFTAFVVWAMLRWDTITDEAQANRWLIFIFYMMGLSIGVHLLNLVTIPALAVIYYFKKHKAHKWGVVLALILGLLIVFVINNLIIPGLPSVAGSFEVFFVNSLRLPFGSGVLFVLLAIILLLVYGLRYSHQKKKPVLNTFVLSLAFILIGYASYAVVLIRANYNPPINENDPSDVMSFVRYLKREQYGTWPLLYGPYFTARMNGIEEGEPVYVKGKDKYEIADHKLSVKYSAKDQTPFPRIWSTDDRHQEAYRKILNLKEGMKPTFTDNIAFLFKHQIGWMYVRYFFFNFAGRESDDQNADWLKPSHWFDALPPSLAENRGRNNFFMIPFLLGLTGMYYQMVKDTKNFFVVVLLFLLTGIALVLYLNSPPTEPRERDYIYVGSYYAFCFWIGFAVIALKQGLFNIIKHYKASGIMATLACLSAPLIMAKEGWNDHDRSDRYFSVDTAINDLQSCAPDSILFSGGDNDTFPQWYVQEVEGVRTDVRMVVTSYFNTDWYVNQTMRSINDSEPFKYTLNSYHYRRGGPNAYLPFYDAGIKHMDLKQYLQLLKQDHKGLRLYQNNNVVPTRDIVLKVDVDKVRAMGIVPGTLEELIVPEMHFILKENVLDLKDLALLDLLATAEWERPVYVTNTALLQFNIDLTPYAVREGNTYRILPVRNPDPESDLVNTEKSFENITQKFQFRGLNDSTIYYTEDYRRAVQNHRNTINTVAEALITEGDTAKARQLLLFSLEKMPDHGVRYDVTSLRTFHLLLELGENDRAHHIGKKLGDRADQRLAYYAETGWYGNDRRIQLIILEQLARIYYAYGDTVRAGEMEKAYVKRAGIFPVRKSDM